MAKCKICKTNISDGLEYCDNCEDMKTKISNESYLDGLLSSVKDTSPLVENVDKKNSKVSSSDIMPDTQQLDQDNSDNRRDVDDYNPEDSAYQIDDEWQDYVSYSIDLEDIEGFDNYNLEDDLSDVEAEYLVNDKDLFGENISELTKEVSEGNKEIAKANEVVNEVEGIELLHDSVEPQIMQESIDYKEPVENFIDSDNLSEQQIHQETLYGQFFNEDSLDEENLKEEVQYEEDLQSEEIGSQSGMYDDEQFENEISQFMKDNLPLTDDERYNEDDQLLVDIPEYEDEGFDPDLNQLLDSFNMTPEDYQADLEEHTEGNGKDNKLEESASIDAFEGFDQIGEGEDDFLSLLSQMSSDDPVSEDVKAINDLLQGKPAVPLENNSMPSDVGEVFSDALKGISSLTDLEANEEEILNQAPEKKRKKTKKAKKEKTPKKNLEVDGEKPKKGLLRLLFGNVKEEKKVVDPSLAETDITVGEPEATPSPKAKVKKSKKKADAGTDEAGSGKKVKKAKKAKKGAAAKGEEGGSEKAAKKSKKPKKGKKSREVIQVIDDIEEDEGRINRLGASLVFVFFGLLVTLILVGTNTVSYTMSIEKATDYFDNREYNDAYEQVYGMEIKDKDFAIYNKIMTVMYVNKQLNSYNNYYSIGKYPQALDSLLKGLRRYDKYIELATLLGIENDLKYVRKQILAELKNEFNLSQKQAMKIISYDDMEAYSTAVIDVVDKVAKNDTK